MAAEKLTKKQQKAAQFKVGKKGKAAAIADHPATPDDLPDDEVATVAAPEASSSTKSKSKKEKKAAEGSKQEEAKSEEPAAAPVKEEKRKAKRKRLEAEAEAAAQAGLPPPTEASSSKDTAAEETKPKRKTVKSKAATVVEPAKKLTFGDDGEVASEQTVKPELADTSAESSAKGSKFILFVGNMAFTTTADYISKHFGQACGEVPSVRLLTKKADPNALANLPASKRKSIAKGKAQDPTKPQSKGCAFVEFKTSEALRKALKFHHTMLKGRKINVELTAGGGGKSENRQKKIKEKNFGLEKERQKLHGKYVAPKNEERKKAREGVQDDGERERKRPRKDQEEKPAAPWGRNGGKERKLPRFIATGANAVRVAPTS